MQKLIDKTLILGLCFLTMSFDEIGWLAVFAMFFAVAISSVCGYLENEGKYAAAICAGYVALCVFVPEFITFLPMLVYDAAGFGRKSGGSDASSAGTWAIRLCWVIVLPLAFTTGTVGAAIAVALSSGVAYLLQYRTNAQIAGHKELHTTRDEAKERAERLEQKNRDLTEKQDYEIKIATLAERNRIAREIHDNVGHMITRSLLQVSALQVSALQVSALQVTHSESGGLDAELGVIKNTLSDAMGSIRSSVHDLHDESIDLENRLSTMIDGFMFCPVKLRYDTGDMPAKIKLCFAAIVREALSNIAKHSNATEAVITLMEHPSFYQLTISDNGSGSETTGKRERKAQESRRDTGIGIQNMEERIAALGGVFRTAQASGFKVFITVPKN